LSDDDQARPILSCKFLVSEGMQISEMAPELVGCLRAKLGAAAQNNPKPSAPTSTAAPATSTNNVESDHK
ncbi:MAG: hypothetical protein WA785_04365, partial [Candidatus Acidiferrales bacterium]